MLKRIAKEYNVNIVGGSFVRKDEGKLFNSCPVINRNGELIAIYNKNHLFSYYGDKDHILWNYDEIGDKYILNESHSAHDEVSYVMADKVVEYKNNNNMEINYAWEDVRYPTTLENPEDLYSIRFEKVFNELQFTDETIVENAATCCSLFKK